MKRLDFDATTEGAVRQYLETRARQLLYDGVTWREDLTKVPGGYETTWDLITFDRYNRVDCTQTYKSLYTLKGCRGLGHATKYWASQELQCLTKPDCDIQAYLKKIGKTCRVLGRHTEWPEYRMVSNFYGEKKAKRSQVFYMNHIDEGLGVLNQIGASEIAARAYLLHPLVQLDADLQKNYEVLSNNSHPTLNRLCQVHPMAVVCAMEYRNIANQYLSPRVIESTREIVLSPLREVNDMLIADKVQNYKDFVLYHKATHPRSVEIDQYFQNWFDRLILPPGNLRSLTEYINIGDLKQM